MTKQRTTTIETTMDSPASREQLASWIRSELENTDMEGGEAYPSDAKTMLTHQFAMAKDIALRVFGSSGQPVGFGFTFELERRIEALADSLGVADGKLTVGEFRALFAHVAEAREGSQYRDRDTARRKPCSEGEYI